MKNVNGGKVVDGLVVSMYVSAIDKGFVGSFSEFVLARKEALSLANVDVDVVIVKSPMS